MVRLGADRPDADRRVSVPAVRRRRASVLRVRPRPPRTPGPGAGPTAGTGVVAGSRAIGARLRTVVGPSPPITRGSFRPVVRRAVVTRTIDDPDARSRRTGAGPRPTRAVVGRTTRAVGDVVGAAAAPAGYVARIPVGWRPIGPAQAEGRTAATGWRAAGP